MIENVHSKSSVNTGDNVSTPLRTPQEPSRPSAGQRHVLPLLLAALLAVVLLALFLATPHTSFAKTTFSFETCATVAVTVKSQPIMLGNRQVGLAQVRYSSSCTTYWARGVSYVDVLDIQVSIPALNYTNNQASFTSSTREAYSNMFYATVPTVVVGMDLSPTQAVHTTIMGDI